MGRLSEEKGVEILLKTWKGFPESRLIIAGDGPDRERLVSSYGQIANVTFVGKKTHQEIIALMKECRALIFPSIWYEGLPLTIIEALATGTPVIASRLGAMQEMILHGENGLLFAPGDTNLLSRAIDTFEKISSERQYSIYNNARETYLEKYHPEKCYQ